MFENEDVGFVIQSRLGSTRLPGKALLYFGGTTIIGYLIKSLINCGVDKKYLCIATSTSPIDNLLTEYIEHLGYNVIRGDEENVFSRYQKVASETGFKHIVRLTGDNPLINFDLIKHCIKKHLQSNTALTTTRDIKGDQITRYVPKGLSVDVISSKALLSVDDKKLDSYEAEHVIPTFFESFEVQLIKDFVVEDEDRSIDTIDDYSRLFKI